MSDIFTVIRLAWKNTWKQKAVWLFSALSVVSQLLSRIFPIKPEPSLFLSLMALVELFISISFWLASVTGVPYLTYCFSIGKPATIRETLSTIRTFSGRVFGFSCLGFLTLLPCLFFAAIISARNSNFLTNYSTHITQALLPSSLSSAVAYFTVVGFFANDLRIWKSIKWHGPFIPITLRFLRGSE